MWLKKRTFGPTFLLCLIVMVRSSQASDALEESQFLDEEEDNNNINDLIDEVDKKTSDPSYSWMGLGKRGKTDPGFNWMGLGKRGKTDPGFNWMGLGKRGKTDPGFNWMGLGKRGNTDPGFNWMGLGKRGNSQSDPSLNWMGLGKRGDSDPSFNWMGLGKRGGKSDPAFNWMGLGKRTVPMRYLHFFGTPEESNNDDRDISALTDTSTDDSYSKKAGKIHLYSRGINGRVDPAWGWGGLGRRR